MWMHYDTHFLSFFLFLSQEHKCPSKNVLAGHHFKPWDHMYLHYKSLRSGRKYNSFTTFPPWAPRTAKQKRFDSLGFPSDLNGQNAAVCPSIGWLTLRSTEYSCMAPTTRFCWEIIHILKSNLHFEWFCRYTLILATCIEQYYHGDLHTKNKLVCTWTMHIYCNSITISTDTSV